MDSNSDVFEHESSAKRLKLDATTTNIGELCNGGDFSSFFTSTTGPIDNFEGIPTDCDSGYEATLESMPPLSHETSPDPGGETHDSDLFLTPSRNADTSQDSIEDDNVSNVSEISGLSELSGQDWKPMAESMSWIQKQKASGMDPRALLTNLGVDIEDVPQYVDKDILWKIIINMLSEPPRRHKLRHVNTLEDVVRLVKGAQNIIVLTGAGVSVSCGIPDFRSRNGIYERLAKDFPNLPDPQAMFDINFFSKDPRPFFKFARDIYPGKFKPSPCHNFIKILEKYGKLLRNYTQNIDTLEKVASIERVIECHGSFATATCTNCTNRVTADAIRDIVLAQHIPLCAKCHPDRLSVPSIDDQTIDYRELVKSGIMKPDIVFFGEGLPDTFHEAMAKDKMECDLLLVIGSSLKVRPVALIPSSLPENVPQILINREPLPQCHFDVELLGDCDVIINHLCQMFGGNWREGVVSEESLEEVGRLLPHVDEAVLKKRVDFNLAVDKDKISDSKTEPNCVEKEIKYKNCSCKNPSTNNPSFLQLSDEPSCDCTTTKQSQLMEYDADAFDVKSVKERHMSVDSARDSGIGDNSNFTDLETKYDYTSDENQEQEPATTAAHEETTSKHFWQPKAKKSLADRLPKNSFYLVRPRRYVFPGAELYVDEKFGYCRAEDDDSSSSGNNSDSEESEADNLVLI